MKLIISPESEEKAAAERIRKPIINPERIKIT